MGSDVLQDRLDLVHHVWRLILRGELYRAPISKTIQRVLDVGTGTGIWAMEFADEFPGATIIANDLSPIQPTWVPPNLQFEIDDVEDIWSHTRSFDYIHVRNMGASIADWQKLCSQSLQNLTAGGWIEIQEHGIEMHSEDGEVPPNTKEWLEKMEGAARTFGKEMNVAKTVKGYVDAAGFEEVHADQYKVTNHGTLLNIEAVLTAIDSTCRLGKRRKNEGDWSISTGGTCQSHAIEPC